MKGNLVIAVFFVSTVSLSCLPTFRMHDNKVLQFNYHDYDSLVEALRSLTLGPCRNMSSLYSIGKSVEGRDLWVMEVSSQPRQRRLLQSTFHFVGGIHGDEPVGTELLLHLMEELCNRRNAADNEIVKLLENVNIHVLFLMNPDGRMGSAPGCPSGRPSRYNANGVDLNRNFEYLDYRHPSGIQPEVRAVMDWQEASQSVLSVALHGGAVVVSYPLDGVSGRKANEYLASPDDVLLKKLSATYSSAHPTMKNRHACSGHGPFKDGITNGAAWYAIMGTMGDYVYYNNIGVQLTVEISCEKFPSRNQLKPLYLANRVSLLSVLQEATRGLKGRVLSPEGDAVGGAAVAVEECCKPVITTEKGEFWKTLFGGTYTLTVRPPEHMKDRFGTVSLTVTVPDSRDTVTVDIYLIPSVRTLPDYAHKPEFQRTPE